MQTRVYSSHGAFIRNIIIVDFLRCFFINKIEMDTMNWYLYKYQKHIQGYYSKISLIYTYFNIFKNTGPFKKSKSF